MVQRGGTPSRWRRGIRALLLVPAALGLTTCFLPTETSPNQRIAFVLPADPVLVTIGVVLVSGATGTAPPETTFVVRAIIGGMTLSRSVDTLFALGDTLLFRPGYLDAAGSHLSAADSAAIRPSYQLVSAGLAVRLDPSSGKISAKANGTDTVQAMVDASASGRRSCRCRPRRRTPCALSRPRDSSACWRGTARTV